MSKNTQHTPGPWEVCGGYTPHFIGIKSGEGYIVFSMADKSKTFENGKLIKAPNYDTQRANADLIAAAPALLSALQNLSSAIEEIMGDSENYANRETAWKAKYEADKALALAQPQPAKMKGGE